MKIRGLFTGASLLAVAACGGSSSTPPPPPVATTPPPPPAATGSSVSSSGVITGFGSIIVSGERHEIDGSTVVAFEDEAETTGDDSRLRLGMRVKIESTETNGSRTADRIEFDEDLKGPAVNVTPDSGDPTIGVFTVAGQTVVVDGNTVFDDDVGNNDGVSGIDIRDLDPANFGGTPINVEISGFPTETGVIATRIDRITGALGQVGVNNDELEVKGFVDSVASNGSSFVINGATFLVSGTIFEDGLAANQSLVGEFVEVKADINGSGDFVAVRVELEDDLDGAQNDDEFEIEGVLQSVDTIADPDVIVVNGVTIQVDDASSLVGQVGNRVEIKGAFNASGVLVITRANLEVENTVRTKDRVFSVSASFFTTRLGLDITPTTGSRIEDDVSDGGDQLTPSEFLNRLMNNDFIEARGFPSGGGVTWTRIEREDEDDNDCRLRGPVDSGSINNPRFSILGVTVDTTGLDNDDFEDASGASIGRTNFFNQLQAGDVVEAQSDDAGTGCRNGELATGTDGEVSFEPDDGVAGNAPPPGGGGNANDDEIVGTARNVNTANNTFEIAGRTITVTPDTLIDASIVERARGTELGDADLRFGDLPETLDQLIRNGDQVNVRVDASGNAVQIEDV